MDRPIEEEKLRNILLNEFEMRVPAKMGNVIHRSGHKIVDPDYLVPFREQEVGQMGAQEPGGACDHARRRD
jgi:hypothetical protein